MKYRLDERGQAAVEAALLLPVLLFLLLGMFTVGYWLNAKQVVTAAAREGARVGALTGDFCQAKAAVDGMMKVISSKGNYDDGIKPPLPAVGQPFTVTVTYKIQFGFKYFENAYAGDANALDTFSKVRGMAVSRMEVPPPKNPPSC